MVPAAASLVTIANQRRSCKQGLRASGASSRGHSNEAASGLICKPTTAAKVLSHNALGTRVKPAMYPGGSLGVPDTAPCSAPSTAWRKLRDSVPHTVVVGQ